jgi:septum site-determining protein MinC
MSAEELFGTETMAELCVRQGRVGDALGIYRRLVARTDDARQARWAARLAELEAKGAPSDHGPPIEPRPLTPTLSPPGGEREREPEKERPSLVIREVVRSGQVVYAQHTDLIVLAAVNAGAQLMADGHIHVYGALRGRAVAGVRGAKDARVFCQRLEAELVGVDAAYVMADDLPATLLGKPRCCSKGIAAW